jgi:malonyl-CoA O-methyltransferase
LNLRNSDAKALIRKNFSRAAKTYDAAAALQREMADLLLARLHYLKTMPQSMLECGCGTGYVTKRMAEYCPHAFIVASDMATAMVEQARRHDRRWFKKTRYCAADMEALPFKEHSFDALICNLAVQWCNPQQFFAEAHRVLKPHGFILFSTFGPDTLAELQAALDDTRVHQFIDIRDLGGLLTQAGFVDPVLDCEWHVRHYATVKNLLQEIKGLGAISVLPGKPGLGGKRWLERLTLNYEQHRGVKGIPATYEVIFAQAWVGSQRPSTTETSISVAHLQRPKMGGARQQMAHE